MMEEDRKDYIASIVDEMTEDELMSLDERYSLIDKRDQIKRVIYNLSEEDDLLDEMFHFTRDVYWGGNNE